MRGTATAASGTLPSLFPFDDDRCAELARDHGTPLFAYRASQATDQVRSLREVLPTRVRLAFATKANPYPALLARFAQLGLGFDCASGGELRRVAAVAKGNDLFLAGPAKRRWELELALALEARVQVESWEEIDLLEEIATRPTAVNLRVHPLSGIDESDPLLGGSAPSAFGFDEETLPAVVERIRPSRTLRVRGIHVFAASNERSASTLLHNHGVVLGIGRRVQAMLGDPLDQIDLGGGLGVRYAAAETPLDRAALGAGLEALLREHDWFGGELVLEPGRFLAAPCGVYLSRVVRVKETRGRRFVLLEGGINHLLRPLLTGQAFPVRAVKVSGECRPAILAGPLCTSLDRLGVVSMPEVQAGDLLAFGQCGAYARTEAMSHFLSHPEPQEIWVSD